MKTKPTLEDLLKEIDNLVQCYYWDQQMDDCSSLMCDDMLIDVFKELYPERYEAAIERAKAEIAEQDEIQNHILDFVNLKETNNERNKDPFSE